MKKTKKFFSMRGLIITSLLCFPLYNLAQNSWDIKQQLHSMFYRDIQKVPLTPFVYCLGSDAAGGEKVTDIKKSSDSGATFSSLTLPFANLETMRDLYFVNENTGWVVGDDGAIYNTVNGGVNWIAQNSGTSRDLLSVHFLDQNTGYITGEKVTFGTNTLLLKTVDGGSNWTDISTTDFVYKGNEIYFVNVDTGFIGTQIFSGSGDSPVYKTTDGGMNWTATTTAVDDQTFGINSIEFVNDNLGYAVGTSLYTNGEFLKTTDGGDTWINILSSNGNYNYLALNEQGHIAVSTSYSPFSSNTQVKVFTSVNGGNSWDINTLAYRGTFYGIDYDNTDIYLCGKSSSIYTTETSSSTFDIVQESPVTKSIAWQTEYKGWITFGSNSNGVAPGAYKTTNGGNSWYYAQNVPGGGEINFIDTNNAFILEAGSPFKLWSTSDGGNSWVNVSSAGGAYIGDMSFADADNGWISGSGATIRRTTNGGVSWSNQNLGVATNLSAGVVDFVNIDTGYCGGGYGGGSGFIQYTYNGGVTWNSGSLPSTAHILGFSFVNAQIGYSVTTGGEVWKTTDAGQNWSVVNSIPTPEWLENIYSFDEDTLYVLARDSYSSANGEIGIGYLYKSEDAGASWTIDNQTNLIKSVFYDFSLQNSERQWLVGSHNLIELKSDGQDIDFTAINEFDDLELRLYPNPAQEYIMISSTIDNPQNLPIQIFDQSGRMVAFGVAEIGANGDHLFDISPLKSGMYFVVIKDFETSFNKSESFIKE